MAEYEGPHNAATGRLVRPYALAGGRTGTTHVHLDIVTYVVATHTDFDRTGLEPEHDEIIALCQQPVAVAEIAARTNIPLFVTKVLLGDLIDRGALDSGSPEPDNAEPDLLLMNRILDRLQTL